MDQNIDPIRFELLKNAIASIADEMALTIVRTSYSGVIKSNLDFSTGFADGNGLLVAQGLTIPGHLGSTPTALAEVLRRFQGNINPGDVFLLNDPYAGGMHLPDFFIFKPIFIGGERLAFSITCCHHADVGGRVAGSNASDSTEIFQEGLRIPPVKLFDRGVRDETLVTLLESNVRLPIDLMGDVRAQLAACHIAERQFLELVDNFGVDTVRAFMTAFIDYTERMTRLAIAELPDGEFSFEDFIDDDGVDYGKPIRLYCTVKKAADRILLDWTGSAPQVRGAINATLSFTKAVSYTAVKSVISQNVAPNEGVFRAIEVVAPPGTIANLVPPAACAARGLTGFRMLDCALGALAMMVPDRVCAASDGGNTGVSIGGYSRERKPFVYVDFVCSAWGGRPWSDGLDGNANLFGNIGLQSAELIEAETPVQVVSWEFIPDRGGAGRYRGGAPVRRELRILEDNSTVQVRSDRRAILPYGLYGGEPGKPSMNWLRKADGSLAPLASKLTMQVMSGDSLVHESAGGGGWGDPLERDPEAVLRDVCNEMVSAEAAARDYGVVIAADHLSVDLEATANRREMLRNARPGEPPKVAREPWMTLRAAE